MSIKKLTRDKTMDWKGQYYAEWIYMIIISLFGFVGFVWGYQTQDFFNTFQVWFVGVAIACLISIPDWGFFNSNTPKWIDEIPLDWCTRRQFMGETDKAMKERIDTRIRENKKKKQRQPGKSSTRSAAATKDD